MVEDQSVEEVLKQWEPKVNSMLRNTNIIGLDREDVAQELRIAIVKAYNGYKPGSSKASFHTYLHVAMLNTIRGLIAKAQKSVQTTSLDTLLDSDTFDSPSGKALTALEDASQLQQFGEADILALLENADLQPDELDFIELRIQGYKLNEIGEKLGKSPHNLRNSVKRKLKGALRDE